MTTADDFLTAIREAGPTGDPSLWLRYADWLEDDERQPGDRLLAESIRLAMELESDFGHAPKLWRATFPKSGRWTIDETVMYGFESSDCGNVIKTCGPITVTMDLDLYWQLCGENTSPTIHADLRFPIAGRHDGMSYRVYGDFHPLYRGTLQDYENRIYRFVIARSASHDSLTSRIALLDRQDIVRGQYVRTVGVEDHGTLNSTESAIQAALDYIRSERLNQYVWHRGLIVGTPRRDDYDILKSRHPVEPQRLGVISHQQADEFLRHGIISRQTAAEMMLGQPFSHGYA